MKICTCCGRKYPATSEYFHKAKTCKEGLNSQCKQCINRKQRENFKTGRYKYTYKPHKSTEEKQKREQKAFERMINEKVEGLDISKVKLKIGKKYGIKRRKNEKNEYEGLGIWTMIQDYKTHILFKHKLGYTESFLKADFLTGDYRVKEV